MWEEKEEKEGLLDRLGDMLMRFFERLNKIISGGEEEQNYWPAVPVFSHNLLEPQPRPQQLQLLPKQEQKNTQPESQGVQELLEPQRRGRPRVGREIVCPRCGQKGIERISVRGERKYIYVYHGLDSRKVPILHYVGPTTEDEPPEPPAPEPAGPEPDRQPA